jgi:S-adenosylmethionine decarboxylase
LYLHKFTGYDGVTGVALLSKSHISVHTWPDTSYAAFDIFMCCKAEPEKAIASLKQVFQPYKLEIHQILSGPVLDQTE